MEKPKRKAKPKNSQSKPYVWFMLALVILVGLGGIGFIVYYQLKTPLATQNRDPLSAEAVRPHILAEANIDRNAEIVRLREDGSIINLTNNQAHDGMPHMLPHGNQIVFMSDRDSGQSHYYDLFVMDTDGGNPVNLTNTPGITEGMPSFSPDGLQIAFSAGESIAPYHLYLMNVDGSNYRRIETDLEISGLQSWSPDGTQIAFYGKQDGLEGLWVINADSTNLHQISTGALRVGWVSWSPLGDEIAFTAWEAEVADIYLINTDGSNLRNFTNSPKADWMPSWTPDGQLLFLTRLGGEDDQLFCDCLINDPDSIPVFLQITDNILNLRRPVWIE